MRWLCAALLRRLGCAQRCGLPIFTAVSAVQMMPTIAMNSVPHGNSVGSVTKSGIGASIAPLCMSSARDSGAGCMWGIGTLEKCAPGRERQRWTTSVTVVMDRWQICPMLK